MNEKAYANVLLNTISNLHKKNSLCQFPTLIDTIFRPKNLCQYAGCDMPIDLR